jgi:hypothetical protein
MKKNDWRRKLAITQGPLLNREVFRAMRERMVATMQMKANRK